MNNKKTMIVFLAIMFSVFTHAVLCVAQGELSSGVGPYDDALDEELEWLKAETYVITASRVMEEIRKSAASITVITDRQLRQMGAIDLVDALTRIVPGVSELRTLDNYRFVFVHSGPSAAGILYMINNHPVNKIAAGASAAYADLMIENIQRVEFIRGPGSALYGANAFLGVVNVITKTAEDIDGVELSARGGSWDTQEYNLLGGRQFGELGVAGNFNYYKTHGFRGLIQEDAQTLIDRMYPPFVSPVSLAPGYTKGNKEKFDATLNLKFKGFTLEGKYLDKEFDTPVSPVGALVDEFVVSKTDYYITLGYETSLWKGVDLSGKLYRNVFEVSMGGQIFPPGFLAGAPTPMGYAIWQDGLLHFDEAGSERTGIDVQTTSRLGSAHTVVAGAAYEDQKATDNFLRSNYLPTPVDGFLIYFPSVQEVPESLSMGTKSGHFYAVFLEDLWDVTRDIRMTTGVRYDRYSNFGGHVSPRAGLTWEYLPGYDVKLLYGHAFRAPSFREMYYPSDGNPQLDPEKIDTYEISVGAQFTSSMNGRITFSHREIKDLIISTLNVPYQFTNGGGYRDQSVDIEMTYDFGRGTYLSGNLAFIDQKSGLEDDFCTGKIWANVRLSRHLNVYVDASFMHGYNKRYPGDPKEEYTDHELANITMIAKEFLKGAQGLELRTSVYNLFDENWSLYQVGDVPFDMPMPGRNYLFELKYTF